MPKQLYQKKKSKSPFQDLDSEINLTVSTGRLGRNDGFAPGHNPVNPAAFHSDPNLLRPQLIHLDADGSIHHNSNGHPVLPLQIRVERVQRVGIQQLRVHRHGRVNDRDAVGGAVKARVRGVRQNDWLGENGDGHGIVGEGDFLVGVLGGEGDVDPGGEAGGVVGGGGGEVEGGDFEGGDGEEGAVGVVQDVEGSGGDGGEEED